MRIEGAPCWLQGISSRPSFHVAGPTSRCTAEGGCRGTPCRRSRKTETLLNGSGFQSKVGLT